MAKVNIIHKLFTSGPLILLYYLSISEVDTNLEKLFEGFMDKVSMLVDALIIASLIKGSGDFGPGRRRRRRGPDFPDPRGPRGPRGPGPKTPKPKRPTGERLSLIHI